jgi:hypothetical protein
MSRRWSNMVGAVLFAVGALGMAVLLWVKRRQLALAAAKAIPGQTSAAAKEQASAAADAVPDQASAAASAVPDQASAVTKAMPKQPPSEK